MVANNNLNRTRFKRHIFRINARKRLAKRYTSLLYTFILAYFKYLSIPHFAQLKFVFFVNFQQFLIKRTLKQEKGIKFYPKRAPLQDKYLHFINIFPTFECRNRTCFNPHIISLQIRKRASPENTLRGLP